ncbi:hypothetical protein MMC20_000658 [Loxospora ochrophaea]|nr:hypothetical protein [Loxospora ochrophaea]
MGLEDSQASCHAGVSYSSTPVRKRKRSIATPTKRRTPDVDLTCDDQYDDFYEAAGSWKKKTNQSSSREKATEEKRLRRFRKHPPQTYLDRLHRVAGQRMFVIDRHRGGTDEVPEETIEMTGSTGNIYSVTISELPSCTCPDNQKGNQCKHIIYILHNVLKAPSHLLYQLAFVPSELRTIFATAPTPASSPTSSTSTQPSNRKPATGDCPICFTEFEPETEEIVWCKAACGNNIHKTCFEQWAASQKGKGVNCVYCRTPWQGDEDSLKRIKAKGKVSANGYVNVAEELGISGERDYSTYHQPWVRQTFGYF